MASNNLSALIWNVAELLRGDFKPYEYGRYIPPFTILRRLDCTLEKTKVAALVEYEKRASEGYVDMTPFLWPITGYRFYNTSRLDLGKMLADG